MRRVRDLHQPFQAEAPMPGEVPRNIWILTSQGKTWPSLRPLPRGIRPKTSPSQPQPQLHQSSTQAASQQTHLKTSSANTSDSCSPTQQLFCCNCSQSSQPFCLRLKTTCQYLGSIAAQLQQEGTQPTQQIPQEHLAQMSKGHCSSRPHRTPSI